MINVQYIKQLKDTIETLSKWESSGKAFGHLKNIKNKKTDRLYEFYCYLRILDDLMENYDIELIQGSKGRIFPQGPASKKGWAYFVLKDKKTGTIKFQVCFGTKIKLSASPKTTFASDISFQKSSATDDPDERDVELIMDAKYKITNSNSLEISTIREFAKCIDDLGVSKANSIPLSFDNLKDLRGNCLLTNGKTIEDHQQYCKNNKVKQVGSFDCDGRKYEIVD